MNTTPSDRAVSNRELLRERFAYLLTLEQDWNKDHEDDEDDEDDGMPIPLAVAVWVNEWLSRDDEDFDGWTIDPLPTGGVELERRSQCGLLVVFDTVKIYSDRIIHRRLTARALKCLWRGYWQHSLQDPHECLEAHAYSLWAP